MQKLKIALNSVDLIPVNIKLLDLKDENESKNEPTKTYINNLKFKLNSRSHRNSRWRECPRRPINIDEIFFEHEIRISAF